MKRLTWATTLVAVIGVATTAVSARPCTFAADELSLVDEKTAEQANADAASVKTAVKLASDRNWDGAVAEFLSYWRENDDQATVRLMLRYFPHAFRKAARLVGTEAPEIDNPECR